MAEWKQQKLGDPKILEDIGKRADQAIEAVNTVMGIVKTGGEVAKLVLLSSMNPVLLAMKAVGEAIVDMANNYREAGFYALYVGYGDGSTSKTFEPYGLAMQRDKDGNYMFENAYVETGGVSAAGDLQLAKNYPVNTSTESKFVKSMLIVDLSGKIRDSAGLKKDNRKFLAPMPVFEYPWRFVRGGWTPESLDGGSSYDSFIAGLASAPNFPQIPATAVVQAMIDAFDDEGDVPLYAWDAGTSINVNTTPVYTREGVPVQSSKQQYAKIGTEKNPGGELSAELKGKWEISGANWKNTLEKGATFYTHLYNKKESLRPSTSVWGSSTYTTVVKSGKPSFKGVGDITIPAETKLVKTGTAGGGEGGTLGANIGTYEVQEISPAKVIPIPNNVVGIAIVAGLPDFQALYELLNTLMNFFGDWPAVKEALDDINTLLKPERQLIQLEQDILWGPFEPSGNTKLGADPESADKYIIGATSGAVGKIIHVISADQTEENRISKWMVKDVIVEVGPHKKIVNETVDTNNDPYLKRWYMHEYRIEKVPGQDFDFKPGEYVYQIKEGEGVRRDVYTYDEYWLPSTEGPLSEAFLEKVFKDIELSPEPEGVTLTEKKEGLKKDLRSDMTEKLTGMDLPPYGIVTGASFENPPASVPPDFVGFQFKEFIPYWAEVFDGIAMFGQAIVDIAEAILAFIQKIIDFIDMVIEKLQELANAIISFIEYFKIGIPEAGIYLLGVSTSDGNAGIQSALKSADNAPPASLKYSSGILLVGVTDNTGVNGVEILGSLLALDFTDVKSILGGGGPVGETAKAEAELQGTGFVADGITVLYEDGPYNNNLGGFFRQLASFYIPPENSGSGYATIPSITIASSGSVVSFRQPDFKFLEPRLFTDEADIEKQKEDLKEIGPVTWYVEEPAFGTYQAPTFQYTKRVYEVRGVEEVLYKADVLYVEGDEGLEILYTEDDWQDGVEDPPGPGISVGDVKVRGKAIGDVKERGDKLPAGKNVGDVKIEGVTAVDPIRSSFQLISPGYGYKIAPKVYISGGRMSGHKTVTKADGEDFDYHTIFTTTLSRAPKAHAILEGDKIASISLDSTGNSYFIKQSFNVSTGEKTGTSPTISIGGVPLKSIKLTEAGRLYKEIPRFSFVPGSGGGRGAVGEVISLDIKGAVEEIELTSPGEEYTSAPEIKISNP